VTGTVRLKALGVPRARCAQCGASCSSYRVGPLLPDDVERVEAALPRVREAFPDQPLDDPIRREPYRDVHAAFLGKSGGFCVFHRQGTGCTIHSLLGAEAKPRVCRLFPLMLVEDEGGARIGVLPTCLHDQDVWADGPAVPAGEIDEIVDDGRLVAPRPAQGGEAEVLQLLASPEATTARLLEFIGCAVSEDSLGRWLDARLGALLEAVDGLPPELDPGPLHPAAPIARLFGQFRSWAEARPEGPWPEVTPEAGPWLRDALRRLVFLRETRRFPGLQWALLGYVAVARWASAWTGSDLARLGPAFAALLVVLETPRLQRALLSAGPPSGD
jgi:Fe-S-cluster containining protein